MNRAAAALVAFALMAEIGLVASAASSAGGAPIALAPEGEAPVTNAQAIGDEGDLRSREAALPPGTKVQVRALRVGVEFVTEVELIQRPKAQR